MSNKIGGSKGKDLTGIKFGKLTVVKLNHTGNHGKEYLCKCDCGNEKIIRGSVLTSGKIIGCGCSVGIGNLNKKHTKTANSKIGEKFNRLTIVNIEQNDKNGGYYYITKCDCGNIKRNYYADLVSGKVKSCGCYQKEMVSITGSRIGLNNSTKMCSTRKWGVYKNGVFIKMRSGFEVMYAQYLTNNLIEWEYEYKTIKLLNGLRYTPDFYLIKDNQWVEIKGMFSDKSKKKCGLFIEIGYNLKIILKNELETITNIKYNKFKNDWDKNMLVE